jgi:hypothetical protein
MLCCGWSCYVFVLLTSVPGRIIISAVQCYIRNVAEDVRDIHTIVEESGERLLSLDCASREHYEHTELWHTDTGAQIRATQDVALSIKDDLRTIKTGTGSSNRALTYVCTLLCTDVVNRSRTANHHRLAFST